MIRGVDLNVRREKLGDRLDELENPRASVDIGTFAGYTGRTGRGQVDMATTVERQVNVVCRYVQHEVRFPLSLHPFSEELGRESKVRRDVTIYLVILDHRCQRSTPHIACNKSAAGSWTHIVHDLDVMPMAEFPPLVKPLGRETSVSSPILGDRLRQRPRLSFLTVSPSTLSANLLTRWRLPGQQMLPIPDALLHELLDRMRRSQLLQLDRLALAQSLHTFILVYRIPPADATVDVVHQAPRDDRVLVSEQVAQLLPCHMLEGRRRYIEIRVLGGREDEVGDGHEDEGEREQSTRDTQPADPA